jgi:hypothetical protein
VIELILKIVEFCKTLRFSAPPIEYVKVSTFAQKIKALKTDEFVGDEYIAGLIKSSKNKTNLSAIKEYLESDRSSNLPVNVVKKFIRQVNYKINAIDKDELLQRLLEKAEHLDDLL